LTWKIQAYALAIQPIEAKNIYDHCKAIKQNKKRATSVLSSLPAPLFAQPTTPSIVAIR